MSRHLFQRLAETLQQPSQPAASKPYWPYPLPEAEMIARYGLRYLTPEEKRVFPGLPLALDVFKARIIKPPAAVPLARAGWVVWIAETYSGCYLARLPGDATLPAPYNKMAWTAVAADEPVTTFAMAKAMEQWRRWQTAVLRGIRQSLQL